MNKEQIYFLLKYARAGVLSSKEHLDEIEYEEAKKQYIEIKTQLMNPLSQSIESVQEATAKIKDTTRPGEKKESAVGKWFGGIGARQKKYQEEHPDGLN